MPRSGEQTRKGPRERPEGAQPSQEPRGRPAVIPKAKSQKGASERQLEPQSVVPYSLLIPKENFVVDEGEGTAKGMLLISTTKKTTHEYVVQKSSQFRDEQL